MGCVRLAIVLLVLALPSSNASALFINTTYQSFGFSWSYFEGEYDLTGTGTMTVVGIEDNSLTLQFSLTNQTDEVDARLTAFGFGINPDVTGVAFFGNPNDGMVGASLDKIPSLKTIEVCAFGGQNCAGGANGGILGDDKNDTFSLKLTGDFTKDATIDPFGFKYQTDDGSYEFSCSTTSQYCGGGISSIPEPGSLALVGVAVAALSLAKRRKLRLARTGRGHRWIAQLTPPRWRGLSSR